jgi:predicted nucleic acid-binding protein
VYLVDTNVISESRKGKKANQGVQAFWASVDPDSLYFSVQTIGELRCGIERIANRGDEMQARILERWLNLVISEYGDRILEFDEDCAQVWGKLMAVQYQNAIDKQIAAIGLIHGLTVVTRNVKDFESTGVQTLNPFL